jgi:hypothetical protein
MIFNFEEITHKLLLHPFFVKAKHVKENSPGHPEDSVYTHLIQTSDFIKAHINGDFIVNHEARKHFQEFMNQKLEGFNMSDIAILTGIVHDIGKILSYKEEGEIYSINQLKPNVHFNYSPHHGYYGSLIIKPLFKDVGIEGEVVNYIANILRLHLIPFEYYKGTKNYTIKETIDDLKPRMEGFHVGVCINAYGDIEQNPSLQDCRELIGKILEEPHFYAERKYFVK